MAKARLDQLLVERGLAPSRQAAQAMIMAGEVMIGTERRLKAGQMVESTTALTVKGGPRYVSRGGLKLEAALSAFALDVNGRVALDIGASTGGFTDCLLQHGAARVYAIDAGRGQLHERLRRDRRVVSREQVNARLPFDLPEPVSLIVVDVSFISLRQVLAPSLAHLEPGGDVVALIKPQFEAGKGKVGKGGVVRDPAIVAAVIHGILEWASQVGLRREGLIPSPIAGSDGNRELLVHLRRMGG